MSAHPRVVAVEAYDAMLEALLCPAFVVDVDGLVRGANRALRRRIPLVTGARLEQLFDGSSDLTALRAALRANYDVVFDAAATDHAGNLVWWRAASASALSTQHPRVITLEDLTERRRLRDSLRASEARLELAMNTSELAMWDWNVERDEVYYNDQWQPVLGIEPESLLACTELADRLYLPAGDATVLGQFERHYFGQEPSFECEYRMSGGERWVLARAKVVRRDSAGKPLRIIGVIKDITRGRNHQQRTEENERRWERAVRGTSDGLYDWDLSTGHVWYAERFRELLGYPADEFPDAFTAFQHALHADDRAHVLECIRAHLESRGVLDVRCRLHRKDGSVLWCRLRGQAERDAAGRPRRLAGSISDISAQLHAEQALRRSHEFYGTVIDSLPLAISYIDTHEHLVFANRSFQAFFGLPADHHPKMPLARVLGRRRHAVLADYPRRALAGATFDVQGRLRNALGRYIEMDATFLPHRDDAGEIVGCFVVARDVTERRLLEAELRQSQKMEAIGRLTGGIAHDFNNLLSVIVGNMQLLARPLRESPRLLKHAETALRAAIRGGELTRRLLAFARQQVLEPRVLDANELIAGMHELLSRTLTSEVEITRDLDASLGAVRVDPGQLENAVLNLVINARDAMPQGGVIHIRTFVESIGRDAAELNLPVGRYAVVEVSDTGCGMSADVLKRACEPFFTTKDVGKGSGLGLSMVYGFVRQSGGHLTLISQVGEGTTVRLYFPQVEESPESAVVETASVQELQHGREQVLVVEDDAEVRATAIALLSSLGYQTLEAGTGAEALKQFMKNPDIALVFSDVMLPGGMLGTHLVQKLRERRPELKVLLTSGFTEHVILKDGMADSGTDLLPKPYKVEELARRIRTALDRQGGDKRALA